MPEFFEYSAFKPSGTYSLSWLPTYSRSTLATLIKYGHSPLIRRKPT